MSDDAVAIANLLYIYAEKIDSGDFAGAAAMFDHAEITVRGDVLHGTQPLLAFFSANLKLQEDGTPRVMHLVSNPVIEIAEDRASASSRSYYTVLQAHSSIPLQVIAAGRYLDAFEKVEDKWRFSKREYVLSLIGKIGVYQPARE
jgi:3-phenylpropionate/cinnamic acid dioxygenase small subunit